MRPFGRKAAMGAALAASLVLLAAIPGCGEDVTATPDDGQYGSVLNAEEFKNSAQALPVEALTEPLVPPNVLPPSATLQNTPAVSMQGTAQSLGSPGTCEAQAFAYGLGSYTAARAPDGASNWDAAQAGNEVSAAYQFALAINNGFATCPKGGQVTQYLSRLSGFGSPSTSDVPYQPSCAYFSQIDLTKAYPDASRLRIGSFATFPINGSASISQIQAYLANGQAVGFSGRVFQNYSNPSMNNGVFYDTANNIIPNSGHGQLLVGYDNNIGTPGNKGALLVQNSFGTGWPPATSGSLAPPGKLWWSYDTFSVSQLFAAVAYPYDPSPPTGTMLASNNPLAPVASITRAYQWAPASGGAVYLILLFHAAEPVRITTLAVKEPPPGIETATGQYGQYISSGYTYLKRTDGNEFLTGIYQIKFQAQLVDGSPVTYTATVAVGNAQPTTPAAASMAATATASVTKLFDTTGQAALLTPP